MKLVFALLVSLACAVGAMSSYVRSRKKVNLRIGQT